MVKLFLLFSQILLILNFKLLYLHLVSLLLLFNLARKHMLAHPKLRLKVSHSCMQVSLLRLVRGRLRNYYRLRDHRNLTPRNGIFKVENTRVKPWESHPLKSIFCCLVNVTLCVFIQNGIFNSRLVKLPDSVFGYLTQVSQWIKGLIGRSQSFWELY